MQENAAPFQAKIVQRLDSTTQWLRTTKNDWVIVCPVDSDLSNRFRSSNSLNNCGQININRTYAYQRMLNRLKFHALSFVCYLFSILNFRMCTSGNNTV